MTPPPERPTPETVEQRLVTIANIISSGQKDRFYRPEQDDAEIREWRGADVKITSDFKWEPDDEIEAHDLLVRTRHAQQLTWLIMEIRDAFGAWIDFTNKYGFYGSLAEAALGHLGSHQPEPEDPCPLLQAVFAEAHRVLELLHAEGNLPEQPIAVIHHRNIEGQQWRTDVETGEQCT